MLSIDIHSFLNKKLPQYLHLLFWKQRFLTKDDGLTGYKKLKIMQNII